MHVIKSKFKLASVIGLSLVAISLAGPACRSSEEPQRETAGNPGPMANPALAITSPTLDNRPAIVALGDSLTAGYGLSNDQSYTTLLQQKLDEKGYRYRVVNAGVSGDTSAGGARRIDWALRENPKIVILELGGNDALRGQPVAAMKKNLAQIIERAQGRGVTVVLAGMEAPQNLGEQYTKEFRQAFRDLANQYRLTFIPFVLDGVGGLAELNQPDGIHPNAEGEKIFTENVWRALEPLLTKS